MCPARYAPSQSPHPRQYGPSCQSTTGCPFWSGASLDHEIWCCFWLSWVLRSVWHPRWFRCPHPCLPPAGEGIEYPLTPALSRKREREPNPSHNRGMKTKYQIHSYQRLLHKPWKPIWLKSSSQHLQGKTQVLPRTPAERLACLDIKNLISGCLFDQSDEGATGVQPDSPRQRRFLVSTHIASQYEFRPTQA